jgi:hypothetical protein
MITEFKQKDLPELIEMEKWMSNEISLVADKLRTIYTTLGWTHMTDDFLKSDELVEKLTMQGFLELSGGHEEVRLSSAGLTVSMGIDLDGFIEIDYYFNLI